jgi:hypothetical protein
MRHVFGATDPLLNLARNWASVGSNAGGPQVGAVVVWAHHVGVIRGGPNSAGEWLVEWAAVHPVLRHTDDPAPLVGVRG